MMHAPPLGARPEPGSRTAAGASLERALAQAAREVRLLAAVTPVNLAEERERLARELGRGRPPIPRYVYAPAQRTELRRLLAALSERVDDVAPASLARAYAARIDELDLEARIAEAAGSRRIGVLCRARFDEKDKDVAREAHDRADEWLALRSELSGELPEKIPSDSPDPASLLSAMRRAIGAARLPFAVEVSEALSSRAATGERTLWVARGRLLTARETRRTVVHEIEGHALPRVRSASKPPIFSIGTAKGTDDQEGFALLAEERDGGLDDERRHEIAARHRAVEQMALGASFAEVTLALTTEHGIAPEAALGIAERAFRGSDGKTPGLGRERVYLGAWLRVRAHLERHPEDEEVLASGQIALSVVRELGTS
jgi:hypothetical protein